MSKYSNDCYSVESISRPRSPPIQRQGFIPQDRKSFLQDTIINIGQLHVLLPIVSVTTSSSCSAAVTVTEQTTSSSNGTDERSDIVAPFATSVEALIPAIRVRNMIDQCIDITKQIITVQQQQQQQNEQRQVESLAEQLQQLLFEKQNFTSSYDVNTSIPSKRTGISTSYKERYDDNRSKLNLIQQPGALFVQRGEIATWERLQQKEYELEQNDEIRKALNVYMNNIIYSSKQYTLRVPANERKVMIRNDILPDILQQVIPSDIDLRTLYRNMVLTSIQDARAELQYQLKQYQLKQYDKKTTNNTRNNKQVEQQPSSSSSSSSIDVELDVQELLYLLVQAHDALQQWFNMIDSNEIQRAEQKIVS
jgi:hypothetical protein